MKKYIIEAAQFCEAIKELATKQENLQNLESYLEWHFDKWLEMWANTPETMAAEIQEFAQMEI